MNPPSRRNYTLLIFGLILFVIGLSLFYFSHQSLRLDESQSIWQTSHSPGKILNIIAQDVHVPLYHFMLHFWQLYLGNSVFMARMLSMIFFIASIPALYFLGKRAFNSSIGFFAATLLAISPFMNWYGNEIRMYSLLVLVTILSQYFFIGIYKYRDADSWVGYAIVALCGIFVHYFFGFVLLVQAVYYFIYPRTFAKGSLKKFLVVVVLIIIAFSPWLYYVHHLGKITNETPLLEIPNSVNLFNTFSQFIFGFQNDHLNTLLVSLWPITVLLGFLALRKNKKISPEVIYFLLSVLLPIAIAFLVSISFIPVFVSRYLILTIPSLYLFIGWVFSTYPPKLERFLKIVLIIVMLIGLAIEIVNPSAPVKENYREATDYIMSTATPEDIIVLSAPFTVYPVEYYYTGTTDITTLPYWDRYANGPIPGFDPATLPQQVNAFTSDHRKVYLLLSYDQGYEEKIRIYMDTHYQRIETKNFSDDLNLYIYQVKYDKPVFKATTIQ